jgi:uncharacterized protein (DUF305 family)
MVIALIGACRSAHSTAERARAPVEGVDPYVARARADSARRPFTEADVRFVSGMIDHHTQAILMAGWSPSHGAGHAVRTLSERIVNAQQDEITLMQRWLRDRRQMVPRGSPRGMQMIVDGVAHPMLMPGMLTDDQLDQLDRARGTEYDRLFLIFMIQHHQGAVTMVKDLFSTPGAGQDETVFKLASDVNVDQTTEIARMQKMLAALVVERRAP